MEVVPIADVSIAGAGLRAVLVRETAEPTHRKSPSPSRIERGATAVEYALMVGLISVGLIAATITLKNKINTTFGKALAVSMFSKVTTFAGTGPASITAINGARADATFSGPSGIAVDSTGSIYVAEVSGNRVRKITIDGTVSTLAGSNSGASGYFDSLGTAALLDSPYGLDVDAESNVFVADYGNGRIRKITPNGTVTTVATMPSVIGVIVNNSGGLTAISYSGALNNISMSGLVTPVASMGSGTFGLAQDTVGNFFVTSYDTHDIKKVTPAGVVSLFSGTTGISGYRNGTGDQALFSHPIGIAIDPWNNLYVAEGDNFIRKVSPDRVVSWVAGTGVNGTTDDPFEQATFGAPNSVAVGISGDLFVTDGGTSRIRKIS